MVWLHRTQPLADMSKDAEGRENFRPRIISLPPVNTQVHINSAQEWGGLNLSNRTEK